MHNGNETQNGHEILLLSNHLLLSLLETGLGWMDTDISASCAFIARLVLWSTGQVCKPGFE